jgi:hypothetical protein
MGAGFKLGWTGQVSEKVTLGAMYAARMRMGKLDAYSNLLAHGGEFDVPERYGVGIAVRPVEGVVIAADLMRVNWGDINSLGNALTDAQPGFGWHNQTISRIGAAWQATPALQLRGRLTATAPRSSAKDTTSTTWRRSRPRTTSPSAHLDAGRPQRAVDGVCPRAGQGGGGPAPAPAWMCACRKTGSAPPGLEVVRAQHGPALPDDMKDIPMKQLCTTHDVPAGGCHRIELTDRPPLAVFNLDAASTSPTTPAPTATPRCATARSTATTAWSSAPTTRAPSRSPPAARPARRARSRCVYRVEVKDEAIYAAIDETEAACRDHRQRRGRLRLRRGRHPAARRPAAGLALPYECGVGAWLLPLRGDRRRGGHLWPEAPGLSERDRRKGRVLACQSRPGDVHIRLRLAAPAGRRSARRHPPR